MDYGILSRQLSSLLEGETDETAILANAAALLFDQLADVNWVGFYLNRDGTLVLGPFQGKPACMRIPVGKGVCGTAFERDQTIRVADVHAFPGHIACDSASNAEIVVPLKNQEGQLIGVLDLDSALLNRFSETDQAGLELVAEVLRTFL